MSGLKHKVGIDEVGRGALAGPAVVGAVILPQTYEVEAICIACNLKALKDSKKLTALQRERLAAWVREHTAWALGEVAAAEIDRFGLTAALSLATERAFEGLENQGYIIGEVLADAGLRHGREQELPTVWTVRGDESVLEITLASSLAKVWRDARMRELAAHYPLFGFDRHVGYGTAAHFQALRQHGPSPVHRRLFLKSIILSS